LKADQDQLISD